MENERMMPPGYRFYPTEEELVGFYLREKLQGRRNNQLQRLIPLVDIYNYNPWDLPKVSGAQCRGDPQLQEWFFFIARQEKEARGGRPNRLTATGYWKATGSPGYVYSSDKRIIGEKRTMVFYKGRAPGSKTDWKMNEYRAIDLVHANLVLRLDFSLCRIYLRSKYIRSYDRRPSPSPSSSLSYHQQNPPLVVMNEERSGSSKENSSSSEDQNAYNDDINRSDEHTSQTSPHDGRDNLGISDMDANMGDEPLWEWEQFLNSTDWMVISSN